MYGSSKGSRVVVMVVVCGFNEGSELVIGVGGPSTEPLVVVDGRRFQYGALDGSG